MCFFFLYKMGHQLKTKQTNYRLRPANRETWASSASGHLHLHLWFTRRPSHLTVIARHMAILSMQIKIWGWETYLDITDTCYEFVCMSIDQSNVIVFITDVYYLDRKLL